MKNSNSEGSKNPMLLKLNYQKGKLFGKLSQICAYGDDIAIITQTISTLKQIYGEMEI